VRQAEENDEIGMEDVKVIPAPVPGQPTACEIEAHNKAHTPYRSWCECCVRGGGKNTDHKRLAADREHLIDAISIDYAFFGEQFREHRGRWTEALAVPCKGGADAWVADMVRRTGLKKVIFKSDHEPSILDLKNKVSVELGGDFEIIMEQSPVEEHEGNGTIERARAVRHDARISWLRGYCCRLGLEDAFGTLQAQDHGRDEEG
jgi:hypothetical protein